MIRKILKFFLLIIGVVLAFVGAVIAYAYFRTTPTFLDAPGKLSGRTETIEEYHVAWTCDCAEWIESRFADADPEYETNEDDCIFIEPTSKDLEIPDSFHIDHFGKHLDLTGQFYLDEGIPTSYEMKTFEKPKKAKVFRYDRFKIVEAKESNNHNLD
jgi:hypothetical protein